MDWIEVAGDGKLISFSKLKYGPTGFEDDLPYTIAVADFGEVKVFGRMSKEIPDDDITIGMSVKVSPVNLSNEKIAHEFMRA